MKNTIITWALMTFVFIMLPFQVFSQWEEVDGIYGGQARFFHEIDDYVFTSNNLGLYRSDKSTISWNQIPDFVGKYICDVTSTNDTVFVAYLTNLISGPGQKTLLKVSFDGGETWGQPIIVFNHISITANLSYLAGNLFIFGNFTSQEGILISSDIGNTWQPLVTPQYFIGNINLLDELGDALLISCYDDIIGSKIYYYDAIFNSWNLIYSSQNFLSAVFYNNSVIITDKGATSLTIKRCNWNGSNIQTLFTNTVSQWTTFRLNVIDNNLFLFYYYQTQAIDWLKSTNGGSVWTNVTVDPAFSTSSIFEQLDNGSILSSNGISIFLHTSTSSFPTNYSYAETGFKQSGIDNMNSVNDVLFASRIQKMGCRSFDNSISFENTRLLYEPPYHGIYNTGDTLFFLSKGRNVIAFNYSFDNGVSFQSNNVSSFFTGQSAIRSDGILAYANHKLYLSASDDFSSNPIKVSDDFGVTWTNLPNSENYGRCIKSLNNQVYSFTNNDVYRLEPSSNNWIPTNSGITSSGFVLNDLIALPNFLFAYSSNGQQKIFNDQSQTWTNIPNNFKSITAVGNTYYTLSCDSATHLYYSTDSCVTWLNTGIELPPHLFYSITSHAGDLYLYNSSNTGVWRMGAPQNMGGRVYLDINNNNVRDALEPGFPNIVLHAANTENYTITDENGDFSILFHPQNSQIDVNFIEPLISINPSTFIATMGGNIDIPAQFSGTVSNLSIDATALNPFRPGFDSYVNIRVKNKGNLVQGGVVSLTIPQGIQFLSSNITPISQSTNEIEWSVNSLNLLESTLIQVVLNCDASNTLGDSIVVTSSISTDTLDQNLLDNTSDIRSIYVGSYDPNDKNCHQGELYTPLEFQAQEALIYRIRFQNTGTFYAENVLILDTISQFLDLNTLKIISSSHTMNATLEEGRVISFSFPNIFLPDSLNNEPESHGFVKYTIQCSSDIELLSEIVNTAYIYFDFNAPIITNTTSTIYDSPLITIKNEKEACVLLVYPNPAGDKITLNTNFKFGQRIQVTDLRGSIVINEKLNSPTISTEHLPAGMFIGNLQEPDGKVSCRFKFAISR